MNALSILHIAAGTISIVSGVTALISIKGSFLHRRSGMIFICAMFVMAFTGGLIAILKPMMISLVAAMFTLYLLSTSLMTIKRKDGLIGYFEPIALTFAILIFLLSLYFGWQASVTPSGLIDGFPAAGYYFFAGLIFIAIILDSILVIRKSIKGHHRLARHLWRMCFALFIATGSAFTGPGMRVFPESLHNSMILSIPELTVFSLMFFWIIRVLIVKKYR